MKIQTHNWEAFKRQIYVQADQATVFRAWAGTQDITDWFIAEARYTTREGDLRTPDECVQRGDQYYWRWYHDLDIEGEILDVVPDESLTFTFGEKGDGSGEKIVVTVTLHDLGDETLVELHQSNIPTSEQDKIRWYLSCNMGWSFYMTNLKARLEYGADLREYDPERAYASRAISHC